MPVFLVFKHVKFIYLARFINSRDSKNLGELAKSKNLREEYDFCRIRHISDLVYVLFLFSFFIFEYTIQKESKNTKA